MKIVALAGGVGGSKLVDGLAQIMDPADLHVVVNTGDDFTHLGLYISPDLDTVCYTLAGMADPLTGWGLEKDTHHFLDALANVGGETWFRLGDRDLATHVERTLRLHAGLKLSQITKSFCLAWGVKPQVSPMSDDHVHTMVDTHELGEIPFQVYFARMKCEPRVKGFRLDGIEKAKPTDGVLDAIRQADAIVICPSNPWVSIDPILRLPGILGELKNKFVVAVSPIIGHKTIKGPAAKIFLELGFQPSPLAIANHYAEFLKAFILDNTDRPLVTQLNFPVLSTAIIMNNAEDRRQLARNMLNFIQTL